MAYVCVWAGPLLSLIFRRSMRQQEPVRRNPLRRSLVVGRAVSLPFIRSTMARFHTLHNFPTHSLGSLPASMLVFVTQTYAALPFAPIRVLSIYFSPFANCVLFTLLSETQLAHESHRKAEKLATDHRVQQVALRAWISPRRKNWQWIIHWDYWGLRATVNADYSVERRRRRCNKTPKIIVSDTAKGSAFHAEYSAVCDADGGVIKHLKLLFLTLREAVRSMPNIRPYATPTAA